MRYLVHSDYVGEFLASQGVQTRSGMSGLSVQLRRHGQVDTKVKGGVIHICIGGLGQGQRGR